MSISQSERFPGAGTEPSNRFEGTAVLVAGSGGNDRTAGSQDGVSVVSVLDGGLPPPDTAGNQTTGRTLYDARESMVPDARAGLTPSDIVTRRLSEMLYPSSFVVPPWATPAGETRAEVAAQDSAPPSAGTGPPARALEVEGPENGSGPETQRQLVLHHRQPQGC